MSGQLRILATQSKFQKAEEESSQRFKDRLRENRGSRPSVFLSSRVNSTRLKRIYHMDHEPNGAEELAQAVWSKSLIWSKLGRLQPFECLSEEKYPNALAIPSSDHPW